MTYRHPVNKAQSAKHFRRQVGRTKAKNIIRGPMRGGWRL